MGTAILSKNDLVREDDAEICCYENGIPPFVQEELASLYGTLHSSLPFLRIQRSTDGASCYLAERGGQPSAIILFHWRARQIEVLNEMIEIGQAELERFVRYMFKRFPQAQLISFRALKTTIEDVGFPVQAHHAKTTYVITLPATAQDYLAGLGKSTRANIRQQTNAVARHLPCLTTAYFAGPEIEARHVEEIIRLSEGKINAGGVKLNHDAGAILALAQQCGFVVVLSIEGRVCAGSINYRVGNGVFGDVTAYDREFEKYSLGKLCVYRTICESIVRGADKFYLGGGDFEFKRWLQGSVLEMDEIRLYRSRLAMLRNLDRVADAALRARIRQIKRLLHRHRQHLLARAAFALYYRFKNRALR